MIETERLKRFGVTQGELERAKTNLLTNIESRYKEKDKIQKRYKLHVIYAQSLFDQKRLLLRVRF
jgi:hypothetical protein